MEALKLERTYTYEEWLAMDDDVRSELLHGVIYMMASPSYSHQKVSMELSRQLSNFLVGKVCEVFSAPFDVRLYKKGDTVLQPDIVVVCDKSKLNSKGCEGAPDLVIEILSPTTASYDQVTKFNEYLKAGVLEYWIVDPDAKVLIVYRLKNDSYIANTYGEADTAPVGVLPGCTIDLALIFQE